MSATLGRLALGVPRLIIRARYHFSFIGEWREDFHGNF
jgi:hypothetical protein